ncbi:hypothetical protein ACSBR2_004728 [Camellia fascicularis]
MTSNHSTTSSGGTTTTTTTTSGGGGPCGACKFLRRKCVAGCIFAPYFDSEQGAAHFAAVHKVFGASNVSKLLHHVPAHKRLDAVVTICYEAQARLRDPVYGCVAHIFALQQQKVNLQAELSYLQAHLATLELPIPPPPPPPLPPQPLLMPPTLSLEDLPSTSSMPNTYDLSVLFEPIVQPSWTLQHRQINPRQFGDTRTPSDILPSIEDNNGSGDLQAVAQELIRRRRPQPVQRLEAKPLPPHSK